MPDTGELLSQALFTPDEAAQLLRTHVEHVRRLIRSGKLKAAKFGRRWKISRADLDAYYQAHGGGKLFLE